MRPTCCNVRCTGLANVESKRLAHPQQLWRELAFAVTEYELSANVSRVLEYPALGSVPEDILGKEELRLPHQHHRARVFLRLDGHVLW
eukprot:2237072-Pyramimonas_sp.AAC.1